MLLKAGVPNVKGQGANGRRAARKSDIVSGINHERVERSATLEENE